MMTDWQEPGGSVRLMTDRARVFSRLHRIGRKAVSSMRRLKVLGEMEEFDLKAGMVGIEGGIKEVVSKEAFSPNLRGERLPAEGVWLQGVYDEDRSQFCQAYIGMRDGHKVVVLATGDSAGNECRSLSGAAILGVREFNPNEGFDPSVPFWWEIKEPTAQVKESKTK